MVIVVYNHRAAPILISISVNNPALANAFNIKVL